MVTDKQVRILMKLINQEKTLLTAAAKAGMCEKTARKYRKSGKLPSQCQPIHDWPTHEDAHSPQSWVWPVESAGIYLTLRWNFGTIGLEVRRSVSFKCKWEIPKENCMSCTRFVEPVVGSRSLAATIRRISVLQESSLLQMFYLKSLAYSSKLIDRMLNIDTVSPPTKAIDHHTRFNDSLRDDAYSYLKLWKYSNLLKPSREDIVFDIGCGVGRILCVFARRPVRKCVGIEISTIYAERARQNAKRLKGRKAPIEIFVADAAEADYSEGTIYCLFNPFGAKTLQLVLCDLWDLWGQPL